MAMLICFGVFLIWKNVLCLNNLLIFLVEQD